MHTSSFKLYNIVMIYRNNTRKFQRINAGENWLERDGLQIMKKQVCG